MEFWPTLGSAIQNIIYQLWNKAVAIIFNTLGAGEVCFWDSSHITLCSPSREMMRHPRKDKAKCPQDFQLGLS